MPDTPRRVRRGPADKGPYVIRSDTPLRQGGPAPIWITAKGREISDGATTANLALARRWTDRPTVHEFLKRRQRPAFGTPTLGPSWFVDNLAVRLRRQSAPPPAPH